MTAILFDVDGVEKLKHAGMTVSGNDVEGGVRIVELLDHPFFLGTLFVPQVASSETYPHPLISAFLKEIQHRMLLNYSL